MLDEYLTPSPFLKLAQTYRPWKRCEKVPKINWDEYIKRMKQYRRKMNEPEMTINDILFCIALLEGSNLDEATKINIEKIARNKGSSGMETRMDSAFLEQTLRKFTVKENQTKNILFTVEVTLRATVAKVKEEEEITERKKWSARRML